MVRCPPIALDADHPRSRSGSAAGAAVGRDDRWSPWMTATFVTASSITLWALIFTGARWALERIVTLS